MPITEPTSLKAAGCCPTLSPCGSCDELDFIYRMPFPTVVALPAGGQQTVPVEVTMRFRLERCSGPLTLGDILYSTTLQPGEQVRLASSDRHTRFSFDSDTQLSSRQYTTSEESWYLAGMAQAASSLSVVSGGSQSSTFHNSSTSGGGSAGLDLGIFTIGGSLSGSSYDARSASTFASFLSQHAESSSRQVEAGVHATASTSIGEVATRSHAQGEWEDQYEAAGTAAAQRGHHPGRGPGHQRQAASGGRAGQPEHPGRAGRPDGGRAAAGRDPGGPGADPGRGAGRGAGPGHRGTRGGRPDRPAGAGGRGRLRPAVSRSRSRRRG